MGFFGPDEKEESGSSEEKTDWLGNKYTEHTNTDGTSAGTSREETDWLGNKYIQHTSSTGEDAGSTTHETDWLGRPYEQHRDGKGNETGYTTHESGFIQNYQSHKNEKGEEVGESTREKDWLGNSYFQHRGERPASPEERPQNASLPNSDSSHAEYYPGDGSQPARREHYNPERNTAWQKQVVRSSYLYAVVCMALIAVFFITLAKFPPGNPGMPYEMLGKSIALIFGVIGLCVGCLGGPIGIIIGLIAGAFLGAIFSYPVVMTLSLLYWASLFVKILLTVMGGLIAHVLRYRKSGLTMSCLMWKP